MSGKFIITFKSSATKEQIDEFAATVKSEGGEVGHRYDTVMKGFSATLSEKTLTKFNSLQAEADSPIDFIEPDGVVTTQ
ncbi:protease propeptide/inhibitor [Mycena metata]|uniref:Protease propeptide/inhibitor n=1 Tax=Mycena metata TaxID=1033252 RepID=A0AAD7P0N8_9AGAR|nr:protease propeptide/inhibitor [Mycena metata]